MTMPAPTASSFGAVGMPLESWILRSALGTPLDPYLTAASALARSARAGCAAMMVHYTRPSGTMPLVEEAKAIARAASDVGIRIAFALAVRDQNPLVYGDSEPVLSSLSSRGPQDRRGTVRPSRDVAEGLYRADRCHRRGNRRAEGRRAVRPRRRAMVLEAAAGSDRRELGATGRRIHMHLLETIYQRAWADQNFPTASSAISAISASSRSG